MGFRVIGIDALGKFDDLWKIERPNAEFISTAVGDKVGTIDFDETEHDGNEGDMYSSVKGQYSKKIKFNSKNTIVPLTTLSKILLSRDIFEVGIMSIDIEGYELIALNGLDLSRIKIHFIIIENNSNNVLGDEKIRAFMHSHGYIYKARIWGLDDI